MPSYQPTPGKLSSVAFGSESQTVPFNAYGWTGKADLLDASSFKGEGYEELVCGLLSGAFIFAGVWNAGHNPFLQAPILKLGQTITNVIIKLQGTAVATAETAIVELIDIKGSPATTVNFVYALRADWKFKDFGNQYAGSAAGPSYN